MASRRPPQVRRCSGDTGQPLYGRCGKRRGLRNRAAGAITGSSRAFRWYSTNQVQGWGIRCIRHLGRDD